MTVLVTGASGFVGSAVVRQLLTQGETVRALLRPSSPRDNLQGLKVDVVLGDLGDRRSLAAALRGCDGLFHVAADYRLWVPRPQEIYAANVDGTRALMIAAGDVGVSRIVYTSSVAVLGSAANGGVADEETPVTLADMIGHYKRSKFLAEAAVDELVLKGLPAVIVNPSTPIGPRDIKPTPTGRLVVEAATGRMPAFVDTGLNIVHVDDVARGHLLAWEKGEIGQRYVLGGENMTLSAILAKVAELAGRRPPKVKIPHDLIVPIAYVAEAWCRLRGRGEPFVTRDGVKMARKKMYFSSNKAERMLGYHPGPAAAAIADALDWFRQNGYLDR